MKKKNVFVIYSLGNFISSQTTVPRDTSIILNIDIQKTEGEKAEITEISFIPVWTQFRNADNVNRFAVRSVYDMVTLSQEEKDKVLRPKDQKRLNDIHYETTKLLLERDIPIEEIQDKYIFFTKII